MLHNPNFKKKLFVGSLFKHLEAFMPGLFLIFYKAWRLVKKISWLYWPDGTIANEYVHCSAKYYPAGEDGLYIVTNIEDSE